MSSRRGRGRLDNGLDAALWSPLRDVDPRVGEHLLDLLQAVGIAAYLEPSADVEPYTRSVSLPSPPSDRLFVDRAMRTEARAVLDEHGPQAAELADAGGSGRGAVAERAALRPDLDEDAEWAGIVSAFEAQHGRAAVPGEPAVVPPPVAHEVPVLDRPDEHFQPPPPPPLPAPAPASLYAVLLVVVGVVLVGAPGVVRLSTDAGLILGVVAIAAGVAMLVSRMRDRSDDDDDGAVV
ncbi:MAG: uncharacterized protein JWR45_250 [Blastococcus sp.]|nr:uncharacterized protein [Blastococcus sp.]